MKWTPSYATGGLSKYLTSHTKTLVMYLKDLDTTINPHIWENGLKGPELKILENFIIYWSTLFKGEFSAITQIYSQRSTFSFTVQSIKAKHITCMVLDWALEWGGDKRGL